MAMGKEDEARAKFIDGIVAEPYNSRSYTGLTNWLKRNNLVLNSMRLNDHAAVAVKDEKNTTITIDASTLGKNDPAESAWMMYAMARAGWHGEKFKKEFPNEPKYRRTMKEEVDSLDTMIAMIKGQKNYAKQFKKLEPSMQTLIKVQEAGLLEPFALLTRADDDIAQDYEPYRAAHRDNVRRYLDEFVVPRRAR